MADYSPGTYGQSSTRPRAWLLLVPLGLVGLLVWQFMPEADQVKRENVKANVAETSWMPVIKEATYDNVKPVLPPEPEPDKQDEVIKQLLLGQQQLMQEMEALKQNQNQPKRGGGAPRKPKKYKPMMMLSSNLAAPAEPEDPAYLLAPGATKIPCIVEPAINSDVEGYLTAKVTTNVYDTATGRQLLIPQNSTILGNTQSSQLLPGNERLDTISLTLTLPDGSTYDLGNAPITDEQGISGLTGRVNHHFWRNVSAVFISGVLRGGAQAAQAATGYDPAGQVAGGVIQSGSQYGQRQAGRYIDTRPTIEVDAGQLCNVILIKPMKLMAAKR